MHAGSGIIPPLRRSIPGGLRGQRGIGRLRLFQPGLGLGAALAQNLRNVLIQLGVKDAAKDQRALLAIRAEDGKKIPLGNHGYLRKLRRIQPQQFLHRGIDRIDAPMDGSILADQLRLGGARRFPAGLEVFGTAPHSPAPAAALKGEAHPGFILRAGKIAAEALAAAPFGSAGGHAVEREGNGIEQRGLARAGIPGDQKQAAFAQPGKIHRLQPCVGAEGAHLKPDGPHAASPPLPRSPAASPQAAVRPASRHCSAPRKRP